MDDEQPDTRVMSPAPPENSAPSLQALVSRNLIDAIIANDNISFKQALSIFTFQRIPIDIVMNVGENSKEDLVTPLMLACRLGSTPFSESKPDSMEVFICLIAFSLASYQPAFSAAP